MSGAWVELVRGPAALTVPGDTLAGAAAAGGADPRRAALAAGCSVCLYWAGMALNDWADRELDAKERPERPLPSGRIRPAAALAAAAGLTAAGLGLAAACSRRALAVATALAGTVWAYDLAAKRTPLGPAAMAAARSLDLLLGAAACGPGAGTRRALPAAAALGAHTLAVTAVSRYEVRGGPRPVAAGALAVTAGVAWAAGRGTASRRAAACASLYALTAGVPLAGAVRSPTAARLRRGVGAGIHAMVPLQAALAARSGGQRRAAALLVLLPVARRLSRRVSPT
ncbi:UbiA family prenyltransferase [Streptomyces capparidis]